MGTTCQNRKASFRLSVAGLAIWLTVMGTVALAARRSQTTAIRGASVGMPVRLESLVLPGSELEVVPLDVRSPVVLRIAAAYPHGTAFRYDLEYHGLEPGKYDLREYLRRKDGSSLEDLPPLDFVVSSRLAAGQVEPHQLAFGRLPWIGGYRILLVLGGILWVAGLVWMVYPRRRVRADGGQNEAAPISLADRLRPLVREAIAGRTSPGQLAELERSLVSYWRQRRGLQDHPLDEVLRRLRSDAEAGPLINQLETWLHRPGSSDVDVQNLLAPYENLPADALENVSRETLEQAS